jgi:hypothetical protein
MTGSQQSIIDASGLIGLLLVFVFGYFAAVLPVVLSLLDIARPDIEADRKALRSRILGYQIVVGAVLVLDLLVIAWLIPLTLETVTELSLSGAFPTVEVGLLIMDVMLLSLLVAIMWLLLRMRRRRRQLLV